MFLDPIREEAYDGLKFECEEDKTDLGIVIEGFFVGKTQNLRFLQIPSPKVLRAMWLFCGNLKRNAIWSRKKRGLFNTKLSLG